jgi:small subunit ribosomal protein S33
LKNIDKRKMPSGLRRFTPAFLSLIDETARKCFGNLPVENYRTGFKLLRRKPIGNLMINHYLPDVTREIRNITPDFNTELEERRAEKLVRLRRRGKGPPKKGHGKRALKKKKAAK